MRFCDLLETFDDALDWAFEDPFLADHLPSHISRDNPWTDAEPTAA